jgi:hypothetical protein
VSNSCDNDLRTWTKHHSILNWKLPIVISNDARCTHSAIVPALSASTSSHDCYAASICFATSSASTIPSATVPSTERSAALYEPSATKHPAYGPMPLLCVVVRAHDHPIQSARSTAWTQILTGQLRSSLADQMERTRMMKRTTEHTRLCCRPSKAFG